MSSPEVRGRDLWFGPPGSVRMPPSCPSQHVDNLPGVFEQEKTGPCCAHCGGDLGVRGPFSEAAHDE